MNDMFDNLKKIKTQLKADEKTKPDEKAVDKQKTLQENFISYMKDSGVNKIS